MVEMNENLSEVYSAITSSEETNKNGFETLQRAMTDDTDSSISGQLRSSDGTNDLEKVTRSGFELQIKEFEEFAEHMSKAFLRPLLKN